MTSLRQFRAEDLFRTSLTNLDPLTENYDYGFYDQYLTEWPELFTVAEDIDGNVIGYMMAKLEASPPNLKYYSPSAYLPWHGHVTALTVAPQYRRSGLAGTLTAALERQCEDAGAYFVDLFVREGNAAVGMYRKMGYKVYRRVVGYYSDDPTGRKKGGEDAFDMRKRLRRDVEGEFVREDGDEVRVRPEDIYS